MYLPRTYASPKRSDIVQTRLVFQQWISRRWLNHLEDDPCVEGGAIQYQTLLKLYRPQR